jgi:hypothetical protein
MDQTAPAYEIDRILSERDSYKAVTALIKAIEAARGGKKLIGHERVIYHPYVVDLSIPIEGIHTTLFNLGLGRFFWAHDGMQKLAAIQRAAVLKDVLDSFGGPDRVKQLAQTFRFSMVTREQERLFAELGTKYPDAREDFHGLVVQYVRQHIDEFRSYNIQQLGAQPGAPLHAGPGELLGNSGVGGGPPSVS